MHENRAQKKPPKGGFSTQRGLTCLRERRRQQPEQQREPKLQRLQGQQPGQRAGQHLALPIAQGHRVAIGKQVVELRAVLAEAGLQVEHAFEHLLHPRDLAPDADLPHEIAPVHEGQEHLQGAAPRYPHVRQHAPHVVAVGEDEVGAQFGGGLQIVVPQAVDAAGVERVLEGQLEDLLEYDLDSNPLDANGRSVYLERFIHDHAPALPPLVRVALVHVQFETIHPFLDGNGRIGRLLIAALLEQWGLLPEPLVYLSGYLKQHQAEYYRRLSAVRTDGDWEGWVGFFLDGVETAATDAERGIVAMASLINADRKRLLAAPRVGAVALRLFELLPLMPRFTIEQARQKLDTTFPTATAAVKLLQDLGMLSELTGQKKNRLFSYAAYVELLSEGTWSP